MTVLRTLAIFLTLTGLACAQADPMAKAREVLRELNGISGSAVGFAGAPGPFHTLAHRVFLEHGDEATFKELLKSDHAVTRAMGIYCLARTGGAKHKALLIAQLGRRQQVEWNPGGCGVTTFSEGQFSWELLKNVEVLDFGDAKPLLSRAELRSLAIQVLDNDAAFDLHDDARALLKEGGYPETYAAVAKETPALSELERVKAAGRFPAGPATRKLLVEVLTEGDYTNQARLAAASGLTRDLEAPAREALVKAKVFDRLKGGANIRKRLLATWDLHNEQQPRLATIDAARSAEDRKTIEDVVIAANSVAHPLALPFLRDSIQGSLRSSRAPVREAQLVALKTMLADLKTHTLPWSTWSDAPYRMDSLLGWVIMPPGSIGEVIGSPLEEGEDADWRPVHEAVQAFIAGR